MFGLIIEIHCFKAYITYMHSQDLWHHGDQFGKINCIWIARYVTWVAIDGILSLYIWYWCKISMGKNKLASGQIAVWPCSGSLRLQREAVSEGKYRGSFCCCYLTWTVLVEKQGTYFQNMSVILLFVVVLCLPCQTKKSVSASTGCSVVELCKKSAVLASHCVFCHDTLKREVAPIYLRVNWGWMHYKLIIFTLQVQTENTFVKVLLHLVHLVTFAVTEHLLKSCIFNVYFNEFWLASLYRIAPWQECVYMCASDLMLFFFVISKGVW